LELVQSMEGCNSPHTTTAGVAAGTTNCQAEIESLEILS